MFLLYLQRSCSCLFFGDLYQEEDDCVWLALQLLRDVLAKSSACVAEDLARLGVPVQLQALAGPPVSEKEAAEKEASAAVADEETPVSKKSPFKMSRNFNL